MKRRLADAETRLRRLQAAIKAGANPAALVDAINRAQEERDVAQAELERRLTEWKIDQAEIEARIDQLAGAARGPRRATPSKLRALRGRGP